MTKKDVIKKSIIILLFALVIIGGFILLGKDSFIQFSKWYGAVLLITAAAFPITACLFSKFQDRGYIFAKPIGIVFSGFLIWLLSSVHILKFNTINCYICIGIMVSISGTIFLNKKFRTEVVSWLKNNYLKIVHIELAFLIIFLSLSYIKGFHPAASSGQEKFMDYGFMKIIDKTDYMPPEDMWLANSPINYYYFGQYISTFVTKASGVGVEFGYNFSLITIFTLLTLLSFSIVYNLLKVYLKDNKTNSKINKLVPIIGGVIAALANTFAGNIHYVLFGLLKILPTNGREYYYADSTRYIGYNPDTTDKTITEFPSYSFIVGDLHAHVVNIIFVLTLIALLFMYVLSKKDLIDKIKKDKSIQIKFAIKELFTPIIFGLGILLGIFKMTNFWDYPIYIVVAFATFLCTNWIIYKKKIQSILATIIQTIIILIVSTIISMPFSLNFIKIASEVKLTTKHSPIYQLLILWGLPTIMTLYFIVISIIYAIKNKKEKGIIQRYLISQNISDLFILILGICAIGLIIVPEVLYVKDIYGDEYQRTNTMFKLTYQAYIMFGLCFGYILARITLLSQKKVNLIVGIVLTTIFVLTIGYFPNAVNTYFGNIFNKSNFKTLNATSFLTDNSVEIVETADDKCMIDWLNDNSKNGEHIVEATSNSYTYGGRISVFTGLATPIGWFSHEWLWRSGESSSELPEIVRVRNQAVDDFYKSDNIEQAKEFIKNYNINYIIVGIPERQKYNLNEEQLKTLGEVVFETNISNNYPPSYIIRCNF